MKYLSLFSGIEAATVAWEALGFEPVAFAEFEDFPKAVLAHHYPTVPDLGGGSETIIYENHANDSRVTRCEDGIAPTLSSRMGTGGGNVPFVLTPLLK